MDYTVDIVSIYSTIMENQKLRLGCAVIIQKGDSILLGLRGKEPNRNMWVIPGGGVDLFESFWDTARREIKEELGLEVEPTKIAGVYELIEPEIQHRVIIYLFANYTDGEMKPSDDTLEARFFTKQEVQNLIQAGTVTPFVQNVLKDLGWC